MKKGGGAKVSFYSDGQLEATFKRFFNQVVNDYEDTLAQKLQTLNELLLEETPVWSGDVVHNWRWSTRQPNYDHEDPVEQPFYPGKTSKMPLGAEPRRRANEARSRRSLAGALKAREPVDIYLTNTSEHAVELEAGLLPTPGMNRARAGYVRLALKQVFG